VLGHEGFGVDDDFFDVGGDSLQAMAMITAIESAFQHRMPLETLVLEGGTIRHLSERIDLEIVDLSEGPKFLNRNKHGPRVFVVPVAGGHMSDYLSVAHLLEPAFSVVGLPFQANPADHQTSLTINELAQDMLSMIATESDAPIRLVGYSFGGAVAYEAAQQLADSGRCVSLVLIDAVPIWSDPLRIVRPIWRAVRRGKFELAQRRTFHALRIGNRATKIEDIHLGAIQRFRPNACRIPRALLIVSEDDTKNDETIQEWRRLIGDGLKVEKQSGDHFSMMREPHVAGVSQTIKAWFDKA
jgi:thioesterase domain-containing protein